MVVERVLWVGCAALALSACEYRSESQREMTTETREVGSFDAIEFEGDARLEISVGEAVEVTVRGQPSVIQRTQTRVTDNTLRIDVERKVSWDRARLTLSIKVPHLRSLELQGGNDVRLRGFRGGDTSIDVNGAARIRASGALDKLTVHLDGAGFADLSRLSAKDAKVTVDGVGSVVVNPQESLEATMNGIGAILYTGTPRQVNSSMNGLGTIGKQGHRGSRHGGWDASRGHAWSRDKDWYDADSGKDANENAEGDAKDEADAKDSDTI